MTDLTAEQCAALRVAVRAVLEAQSRFESVMAAGDFGDYDGDLKLALDALSPALLGDPDA